MTTIAELVGVDDTLSPFGSDAQGELAIYGPEKTVDDVPLTQLGTVGGPPNVQPFRTYDMATPIANDEFGMQGPFYLPRFAIARRAEGRSFPLNLAYGHGISTQMPGRNPTSNTRKSAPYGPGQSPSAHRGVSSSRLTPNAYTSSYTTDLMMAQNDD